jgi:hypothetical protein
MMIITNKKSHNKFYAKISKKLGVIRINVLIIYTDILLTVCAHVIVQQRAVQAAARHSRVLKPHGGAILDGSYSSLRP